MGTLDVIALSLMTLQQISASLPDVHTAGDVIVATILAGIKWSDHERGKRRDRRSDASLSRISAEIAELKDDIAGVKTNVAVLMDRSKHGRIGDS
jgi:hypothetical protein